MAFSSKVWIKERVFFIVRRHHTHICAYIFPETLILYTTGNRKDKKDSKHNIKKNLKKKKRESVPRMQNSSILHLSNSSGFRPNTHFWWPSSVKRENFILFYGEISSQPTIFKPTAWQVFFLKRSACRGGFPVSGSATAVMLLVHYTLLPSQSLETLVGAAAWTPDTSWYTFPRDIAMQVAGDGEGFVLTWCLYLIPSKSSGIMGLLKALFGVSEMRVCTFRWVIQRLVEVILFRLPPTSSKPLIRRTQDSNRDTR